jgi:hypothetical protein
MNRTYNNNSAPTHPKANEWLTEFMIDLKYMAIKQGYQPFTMERLEEWSKYRADIETCADFEFTLTKRLHNSLIHEHASAITHFNQLVIDLKLMVSGISYDAITEERVKEADTHFLEITRCRKNRRIYY